MMTLGRSAGVTPETGSDTKRQETRDKKERESGQGKLAQIFSRKKPEWYMPSGHFQLEPITAVVASTPFGNQATSAIAAGDETGRRRRSGDSGKNTALQRILLAGSAPLSLSVSFLTLRSSCSQMHTCKYQLHRLTRQTAPVTRRVIKNMWLLGGDDQQDLFMGECTCA